MSSENTTEFRPDIIDYLIQRCETDPETGCWNWTMSLYHGTGYGQVSSRKFINETGKVAAHTLSYYAHFGPYPDDKIIIHSCDNRKCFNPAHLRAGTHLDNTRDKIERGRDRPRIRLSKDQVEAIIALMKIDGVPRKLIARAAGVSYGYPYQLRDGTYRTVH